jgi:hypothetical protein
MESGRVPFVIAIDLVKEWKVECFAGTIEQKTQLLLHIQEQWLFCLIKNAGTSDTQVFKVTF